jgi:Cytochrome P460
MKSRPIPSIVFAIIFFAAPLKMALSAQQDRFTIKSPNGISFSEFRGYDAWQTVAVSRTGNDIKAILGNPAMIAAYKSGIPGNGKAFPDGVKIVKIEWKQAPNPLSPYAVEIPNTLDAVAFIEKDSKRFPDSSGWGYAQLNYDLASGTFKAYGDDPNFGTKVCYQCHTIVKATDYIFTKYQPR